MKKLIALLLCVVTVFSLCAACTAKKSLKDADGLTDDGRVLLSIGLPTNAMILDYDDNALTRWVEEKTGFELQFQPFSGGSDIATQIATRVAAQEALPDVLLAISLGDDVISRYGKDEYFLDLQDYYYNADGTPNYEGPAKTFWERFEATFSEAEQENILRLMTEPEDGAIYCVPTLETSLIDIMDYQMFINTKWLEECNLEKPTNLDELYNVLKTFKQKYPGCVPLYGSGTRDAILGADIINWLINNYIYFNDRKTWNVGENGTLYAPFTTNEYREALKFINKLIDEGLMLDSVFNTKSGEMKMVITPASGEAMVGVFGGHLTLHATQGNEVLYQYDNLAPLEGQYCVFNDNTNRRQNFITTDCLHPDEAFELMMTLWSQEASYRIRYGEKGVNWVDADEGAVSELGLPATYKLLKDPIGEQNTCMWFGGVGCTLVVFSEGETAQSVGEMEPWLAYRSKLAAQSRKLFDEAAEKNNPEVICPSLVYTEAETEKWESVRTACADYYKKAATDFMTGVKDPNNNAHWEAYLKELNKLGLEDWIALAQKAYDRQ